MNLGCVDIRANNFGLRNEYKLDLNPGTAVVYYAGKITIQGKSERFVNIELMTSSNNQTVQKDVGSSIARGVIGGLALGPIGAIGGLLLGKNKVEGRQEFLFKVNLTDGKFFIIASSSPTTSFHSLIPVVAPSIASSSPTASFDSSIPIITPWSFNPSSRFKSIPLDNDDIATNVEYTWEQIKKKPNRQNSPKFDAYFYLIVGEKDIEVREKYILAYVNEIVIPLFKKNKKSAFTSVKWWHSHVYPHFHSIRKQCNDHGFFSEYEAYINGAAARAKFSAKTKQVKLGVKGNKLAGHLYDLAEMYATGEVVLVADKYANDNITASYPVCEKNVNYANKLVEKALVVAKENLSNKAQILFLKKCNGLKEILGKPTEVVVKTEPSSLGKEPSISMPPISIADELKKLAELRDLGVLTDKEFQSQKKRLLN